MPIQELRSVPLASPNRRSENIRVLPIVIAELELGNIERHIFAAHFVECADDTALEDRPKSFDSLSVDRADHILASGMINDAMRIVSKVLITNPLISAKQADFVRDGFADEGGESSGIHVRNHASNHVALAADSADDWSFAGTYAAGSTATAALIPMPVFGQAANESFINFDNAAELINVFHQCDADAMAHIPRRFQRTEAHITPDLTARLIPFLAGEHQMNNADTSRGYAAYSYFQRSSRRYGRTDSRLARISRTANATCGRGDRKRRGCHSAGNRRLQASGADQVSLAGLFVWEQFFELRDRQLVDLRWLFSTGHGLSSEWEKDTIMNLNRLSKSGNIAQIRANVPLL